MFDDSREANHGSGLLNTIDAFLAYGLDVHQIAAELNGEVDEQGFYGPALILGRTTVHHPDF